MEVCKRHVVVVHKDMVYWARWWWFIVELDDLNGLFKPP